MTSPKNVVIAISGLHGVGKTSQARRLAEWLGLRHVSGGSIFRKLAKSKGMALTELSLIAEKSDEIDRSLDGMMVKEGKEGDVVVDSLLCTWFLKDIATIKIFLFAPEQVRIQRIASRDKKAYKEAYEETITRESSEINRFKKFYNITLEDVKNSCHLLLSTEGISEYEVFSILKYYVQTKLGKLRQ